MKTFKRKIVETRETIVQDINKDISFIIYKKNNKIINFYFLKTKEIVYGKNSLKKHGDIYTLYKDNVFEELNCQPYYNIDFEKYEVKFEDIDLKNINVGNLLSAKNSSHIIYKINNNYPLSLTYQSQGLDYVEQDFDIDKLEKHFLKNKFIKSVKKREIPYYNANYEGERSLAIVVKLDQKTFNKYWKIAIKTCRQYPSTEMKNFLSGKYYEYNISKNVDILKVKKFYKGNNNE